MNIHFYQFDDEIIAHEIEHQERLKKSEHLIALPEESVLDKLEKIVRRMLVILGEQMALWGCRLKEWAGKSSDAQFTPHSY